MSGQGPWWMDPEEILGRPPLYPVTKPAVYDREHAKPEEISIAENVLRFDQSPPSAVLESYLTGVINAVAERMERAAEAMLTDPHEWGILALEDWHGMDFRVGVWLHPDVPYGEIRHHKVNEIDLFVAADPALSEGRARLIE